MRPGGYCFQFFTMTRAPLAQCDLIARACGDCGLRYMASLCVPKTSSVLIAWPNQPKRQRRWSRCSGLQTFATGLILRHADTVPRTLLRVAAGRQAAAQTPASSTL